MSKPQPKLHGEECKEEIVKSLVERYEEQIKLTDECIERLEQIRDDAIIKIIVASIVLVTVVIYLIVNSLAIT
jgi:hypothetical protein